VMKGNRVYNSRRVWLVSGCTLVKLEWVRGFKACWSMVKGVVYSHGVVWLQRVT
jgi:hypothetical protein